MGQETQDDRKQGIGGGNLMAGEETPLIELADGKTYLVVRCLHFLNGDKRNEVLLGRRTESEAAAEVRALEQHMKLAMDCTLIGGNQNRGSVGAMVGGVLGVAGISYGVVGISLEAERVKLADPRILQGVKLG